MMVLTNSTNCTDHSKRIGRTKICAILWMNMHLGQILPLVHRYRPLELVAALGVDTALLNMSWPSGFLWREQQKWEE